MSNLVVSPYNIDNVFVLKIMGRIEAAGEALNVFREALQRAIDTGNRQFIFNLADVTHIDSMGLSALIRSRAEIERSGGEIRLTGLKGRPMELMVLTKLVTEFEVLTTDQEAVVSFRGMGATRAMGA